MTSNPEPRGVDAEDRLRSWIADLGSDDTQTRRTARHALVDAGRSAVPHLIERLGDEQDRVRWEAAKALGKIGDSEAAPALVAALEDDHDGVRWLAAEALIVLGRDALPALLDALAHRPDSTWLRHGAHHVIGSLPMWKLVEVLTPLVSALEHTASEATVPVAASSALEAVRAIETSRRTRRDA